MTIFWLAVALSLSCISLLGVIFSTSGKLPIYVAGMATLWLIVLLAAAAAWTAVAGRVAPETARAITDWYWWALPIFCIYVSYQNYVRTAPDAKQSLRFRLIGAILVGGFFIALGVAIWPSGDYLIKKELDQVKAKADTTLKNQEVIKNRISAIDTTVKKLANSDTAQTEQIESAKGELWDKLDEVSDKQTRNNLIQQRALLEAQKKKPK